MPELIQVLQSLAVIVFAPLYTGAIARAEAVVGSKRDSSVLQPYWALRSSFPGNHALLRRPERALPLGTTAEGFVQRGCAADGPCQTRAEGGGCAA